MVCGSIGHGGVENIRDFYNFLKNQNFDVLEHIQAEGMDYSHISDFRDKKDLSQKIVDHDLDFIKKADVIVVLVDEPSYGTAIEMYIAKSLGKKIILFGEKPVPTPWPIYFSDQVILTKEKLVGELRKLEKKK